MKEDAARKVERSMNKRAAVGYVFQSAGTELQRYRDRVTPKGVSARVFAPPIEGRLTRGEKWSRCDHVHVKLLSTDPQRGFIDFSLVE